MNYDRLEQNLYAVIKEQQIKLGYSANPFLLYYPLRSLELLLGVSEPDSAEGRITKYSELPSAAVSRTDRMLEQLRHFANKLEGKLGKITVTARGDRFCFGFEPEAAKYVHEEVPGNPFLEALIAKVSSHDVNMEDVLDVFRAHSEHVHIEEIDDEEFDVLAFFEDGIPDDFRYCLADELGHVTYHRFTPEEYQDRMQE